MTVHLQEINQWEERHSRNVLKGGKQGDLGLERDPQEIGSVHPRCLDHDAIRVCIVDLDGECWFGAAQILDVLAEAGRIAKGGRFAWKVIDINKGTPRSSEFRCNGEERWVGRPHVVVLLAGDSALSNLTPSHLGNLRKLCHAASLICASGSAILALIRLGLLDGSPVAIAPRFRAIFRELQSGLKYVDLPLCRSGRVITCAGGIEVSSLAMMILREYCDDTIAQLVGSRLLLSRMSPDHERGVSISAKYGFRNQGLSRAIAFITENLNSCLTTKQITSYAGLSSRQLERLFRLYLNTSPRAFLMNMRLKQACELLNNTQLSLTEIAHSVGFVNSSHFGRCFRRHLGVNPGDCRRDGKGVKATRLSLDCELPA